jgi:hypothetical protein
VAVAKREEMVWSFRSTGAGEKASKSVNERSFMKRMFLIPFIGGVLSHRIASNVLSKLNPSCQRYHADERRFSSVPAQRPKMCGASIDERHSMAKSTFLPSDFLPRNQLAYS